MANKGRPAANAFVRISADDAALRQALRNLRRRLRSFFASIQQMASMAGKAISAGLAAGLAASLTLAVKFEDVLTRTRGVFGELAQDAENFARALAGRVGKSVSETLDMVQEIGAEFRAAGLSAASSFELASRTAASVAVLADRMGLDEGTVRGAMQRAAQGQARGLQRMGLGINQEDLNRIAGELGLNVRDSADQIRLYAAVLEKVEARIDTNTASIGQALDDGENASQRLSRIYAQIRDQLTELGQRMLPVFSNILAGVSVMLSEIGDAFSEGGLLGIGRLFLDSAKPFTDVVIAGLVDVFNWVFRNFEIVFNHVADMMSRELEYAINRTLGRGIERRAGLALAPQLLQFDAPKMDEAFDDLLKHLDGFGKKADETALELKEGFDEILANIKAGSENLRKRIDEELGEPTRRAIMEAAGTFSARAAFALDTAQTGEAQRWYEFQRESEKQTKELEEQTNILEDLRDIQRTQRRVAFS